MAAAQLRGRLGHDDFERWSYARGKKMAAARGSFAPSKHDVRMQLGLAILQRDVADERQNLYLFL